MEDNKNIPPIGNMNYNNVKYPEQYKILST